jgi:hypothetical protein
LAADLVSLVDIPCTVSCGGTCLVVGHAALFPPPLSGVLFLSVLATHEVFEYNSVGWGTRGDDNGPPSGTRCASSLPTTLLCIFLLNELWCVFRLCVGDSQVPLSIIPRAPYMLVPPAAVVSTVRLGWYCAVGSTFSEGGCGGLPF